MHRHGLAHAYGHVSLRIDADHFLVTPAAPLGAVTASERGVVVPIAGDLPTAALPEVRLHREIYRRRADVGGICRVQPPAVMALSALGRTPRVLHGLGAYFAPRAPLWPGVALVRDDARARAVIDAMGASAAIVLSGNGCVVAGQSLEQAAALTFFLEDAARLELALLSARGDVRVYTEDEARERATGTGGLFERMWAFLCLGDEEWEQMV